MKKLLIVITCLCFAPGGVQAAPADPSPSPLPSRPRPSGPVGLERPVVVNPQRSQQPLPQLRIPRIELFANSVPDCRLTNSSPLLSYRITNFPTLIKLSAVYRDGRKRTFYTRSTAGAESAQVAGVTDPGVEPGIVEYLLEAGATSRRLSFKVPLRGGFTVGPVASITFAPPQGSATRVTFGVGASGFVNVQGRGQARSFPPGPRPPGDPAPFLTLQHAALGLLQGEVLVETRYLQPWRNAHDWWVGFLSEPGMECPPQEVWRRTAVR